MKRPLHGLLLALLGLTGSARAEAPAPDAASAAFLACVRKAESHGDYTAVNPHGYYGAYQFQQGTWNKTARHAGRADLVGVRPDRASAADQDLLAATLLKWLGQSPWHDRCR